MSPGSRNSPPIDAQGKLAGKKANLWRRATIIHAIRCFFLEHGYLEIETPYLIPAPAPEAHIDAIPAGKLYLHTSPELCMKRLLSAGYSKIFQIGKCFRQGERGENHLPEFTLIEWYRAGIDYWALMSECEDMILSIASELGLNLRLERLGQTISLQKPWHRIPVKDAFDRYASISMDEALAADKFDEVMVEEIECCLGTDKPVFIYDYPASLASLARLRSEDRSLSERFELYIGGYEIANAFSELTDADEQEKRFKEENKRRKSEGKNTYPMPTKFLNALAHMPNSAGIALGIDRLVMLFANTDRIDDVVTFTPEEL